MTHSKPQPDLILTLDFAGVIEVAQLNGELAEDEAHSSNDNSIDNWVGKAWRDTCEPSNMGKVDRIVSGAVNQSVSGYSQINQQLPNGQSVLFEFVAIQTSSSKQQIVVLGKNLNAVVNLQNRLLSTQQSMETEFWKLRELETRYSTLVNANADAVLVLREPDLKIIDANEQALRTIGLAVGDSLAELVLSERDTRKLSKMLATAKQSGRAPLTVLKIGSDKNNWRVRTSSYEGHSGVQYVVQFSIHNSITSSANVEPISGITFSDIVTHLPDGMVAINQQNIITHTNPAFATLINRPDSKNILGQSIDKWLLVSHSDLDTLRARLTSEEMIYNFPSQLTSANETTASEVLLSAKRVPSENTELMLMLIRPAA